MYPRARTTAKAPPIVVMISTSSKSTQTAMSMEVNQNHLLKRGAKSGRRVISIPEIPSPALNHRDNLIFTDHQNM
jgi:hypothetical protein